MIFVDFLKKFSAKHKKHNITKQRGFFAHAVCALDATSMGTVVSIGEPITDLSAYD